MANEEDTELYDLVMETLQNNGALGKLKAQARANIVLAMEKERQKNNMSPLVSPELDGYLKTPESSLMLSLICDFMDYYNLKYAQNVFDCETYEGQRWSRNSRNSLCQKLGLRDVPGPLLPQLMKSLSHSQTGTFTSSKPPPAPVAETANVDSSQASEGDSTPKVTPRDLMETTKLSVLDLPPLDMGSNPFQKLNSDLKVTEVEKEMEKLTTEDFQSPASLSVEAAEPENEDKNLDVTDTEEPITEDIPEDFDADDLLNSSVSGLEDLTGVETVSGISGKSNDYMEDL